MHKPALEDYKINVKLKLSALWIAVMLCYVYGDFFSLFVPGRIEGMMGGHSNLDNPLKLFAASALMAIPALMVFFSVALKPLLNKWLNIIFGSIYTLIMILIAVTSSGNWWAFYIFFAILESILTAAIVWYSVKWPAQHVLQNP